MTAHRREWEKDPPTRRRSGLPVWVIVVSAMLASTEPLSHVWLASFPPEGAVSTGLRIHDDVFFIHSMRMFETDFFSPFASCKSEFGQHHVGFYPATFHWLYGAVGALGRMAHGDEFLVLGVANGLGAFLYLLALYVFFRAAVPAYAPSAYLLCLCGGGVGGALYAGAGALGLHEIAGFEIYYGRAVFYELVEGPHVAPWLHFPRLYYTLPLALGWTALAVLIQPAVFHEKKMVLGSAALLGTSAFLNMRVGVPLCGVAFLYFASRDTRPLVERMKVLAVPVAATLLGAGTALALLRTNPAFSENNFSVIDLTMWVTPFLSATALHLFPSGRRVAQHLMAASPPIKIALAALLGYLGTYLVLFAGVTGYYGAWPEFWDYGPPPKISDWALLGVPMGAGAGLWCFRRSSVPTGTAASTDAWISLWLLLFTAVALSAWGQGWFARFAPSRLMIFLGPPLAILSAQTLEQMRPRFPKLGNAVYAAFVTCGLCSLLVSLLYFQGTAGRVPGRGPFLWTHSEIVSEADASVIDVLPAGRVLAPIPGRVPAMGDILSLRRGTSVVVGIGTMDHSDQSFKVLERGAQHFFDASATPEDRRRFLTEWCVEFIYCPDTWPVSEEVIGQLDKLAWLRPLSRAGNAVLFQVELPR